MDCNKDEAMRARELAETYMLKNDFMTAQKLGQKAQKLFPELDNISQLLTVCDVHSSAQIKLNGTEMDWYAILQVGKMADEATIKRQYRKHALLLHPDKNKFAGAEAAFKLIGEANRMLTDYSKRSLYDMKIRPPVRTAPKAQAHPANRSTYVRPPTQYGSPPIIVNSQFRAPIPKPQASVISQSQETFWTCCSFCKVRFQYYKNFINSTLKCQSCAKPFIACVSGPQAPPQPPIFHPRAPNQKEFPTQGFSKVSSLKHPSHPMAEKHVEGSKPRSKTENAGQGFRTKVDFGEYVSDEKDDGVRVPNSVPNTDASIPVQSKILKTSGKKRKRGKNMPRNMVLESSESLEVSDSDASNASVHENGGEQTSGVDGGPNRRTSARNKNKRNVTYFENLSDDESNEGFATSKTCSVSDFPAGLHGAEEGGVKGEENAQPLPDKMHEAMESKARKEDDAELETEEPSLHNILETQFNDFEKSKEIDCFCLGQMWALYDTLDGMPRYYAVIEKVPKFKFYLQVRWLEPAVTDEFEVDWVNQELPVASGVFRRGLSGKNIERNMFSHRVEFEVGKVRKSYVIYPWAGETWALFKDWDTNWVSERNENRCFTYEIVEVVSDFVEGVGVEVVYLEKIRGFVSLFAKIETMDPFTIPREHLFRFSHRVPSCRMAGTEREGVPQGSFELDTAALPNDLQVVFDEAEMESGKGVEGTKLEHSSRKKGVGVQGI